MEYKTIRDLAALMREMGLTSLAYTEGETVLKMERSAVVLQAASPAPFDAEPVEERREEISGAGIFTVSSPMVGVFYASPSADKPPYVAVGDSVRAGDVLCIIEAMKIMNEITAERDGVICEICAENKQVVEFGQPLFRIDTNKA